MGCEVEFVGRVFEGSSGPCARNLFVEPDGEKFSVPGAPIGAIVRVFGTSDGDGKSADVRYEVLSSGDGALADLYEILVKHRLNPAFPDEVNQETARWLESPGLDDPALEDLSDRPFVTIDGATSKDLDQAVFVEHHADDGEYLVHYALADASYYVAPGSALWREAEHRAASYYLPGLMVPMLPRALSEGLISLNPGVERRALVFQTHLDQTGAVLRTSVVRAKIRSLLKLSFERVERYYSHSEFFENASISRSLDLLKEVGQARLRDAHERDVVRYRRTEVDAHIAGKKQRRFVATSAVRRQVEAYNEQLSLLCNSEGARLLKESSDQAHVEAIYRVHPAPEAARLEELRQTIQAVARSHGLPAEVWQWRHGESLSDYLRQLPHDGPPGRVARAIHRQAVMVNVRSSYQQSPDLHFGVGAEAYARFSAPMRELVGIYLHAELLEALKGDGQKNPELTRLVVERANHAKQVQKQITNAANLLVLDQLFEDQLTLSEEQRGLQATVMGLTRGKVYVEFDEPPIDAKVRLRDIKNHRGSDRVAVSDDQSTLLVDDRALCRLGDPVTVLVLDQERRHGRWALSIL